MADPRHRPRDNATSSEPPPAAGERHAEPEPAPVLVRARSPYVWVRRLLLTLGVVALLSLGVMLAAYQFGRTDRTQDGEPVAGRRADDQALTVGGGFGYTQWSAGRRVVRIRGWTDDRRRGIECMRAPRGVEAAGTMTTDSDVATATAPRPQPRTSLGRGWTPSHRG